MPSLTCVNVLTFQVVSRRIDDAPSPAAVLQSLCEKVGGSGLV